MRAFLKKLLIILFWLAVWQLLSLAVHNVILLSGPFETLKALWALIPTKDFWISVATSLARILAGFLAGSAIGILLASLSASSNLAEEVLNVPVTVIKAIPVASFVIMVIIWAGNVMLSFWISLLVVFPTAYFNTLQGIRSADVKMLEMAKVYKMPFLSRVRRIYFPSVFPFLRTAVQVGVGMAWKSGVAAELIGQPLSSLGNGLYQSKIFLATDQVLAWTVVIVLLSWGTEKLFLWLFGLLRPGRKYGL